MEITKLGIVMRETTPDFRQGFEFAVKCIYDLSSQKDGYGIDKLNETLNSIVTLIDNNCWWPDIHKVIMRE